MAQKSTLEIEKCMAFEGVWVIPGIHWEGVDCMSSCHVQVQLMKHDNHNSLQ